MNEQTILAISLFDTSLIPALIENCKNGFTWQNQHSRILFSKIQERYKRREDSGYFVLQQELEGHIPLYYWNSLISSIQGIPVSSFENEFFSAIKIIKTNRAQNRLASELGKIVRGTMEWSEIERIVEEGKVIRLENEKSDLETAFGDYLEMNRKADDQLTLGFPGIDGCYKGLRPGEIMVITGRPGVGKTMMILNMVENIIPQVEYGVGLFSLEMPKSSIVERWLQIFLETSEGEVSEAVKSKDRLIEGFRDYFRSIRLYTKIYSTAEIGSIIKQDRLKVIFLDPLGLVRSFIENPYQRASQIIGDLKQIAKDRNVILIIVHHPSRSAADGADPIGLGHLRDSGKIEEIADFVLGLWRPELNPDASEKWKDILRAKLIKNRRGPLVTINCCFNKTSGKIRERMELN